MSKATVRRFDLYDFFSILVPGLAFEMGLLPLLPAELYLLTPVGVIPLLVFGFVLGRAIHPVSASIERTLGTVSHRERFERELISPETTDIDTVREFYRRAKGTFGIGLREFGFRANASSRVYASLYSLVRGTIHVDGRARSRTFQAVYSFYRSIWIISIALAVAYFSYGCLIAAVQYSGGEPGTVLPYEPLVLTSEIPIGFLLPASIATALVFNRVFRRAKSRYQAYYVQYLITDFILLDELGSDVDPRSKPTADELA